jgi:hypothetical protein
VQLEQKINYFKELYINKWKKKKFLKIKCNYRESMMELDSSLDVKISEQQFHKGKVMYDFKISLHKLPVSHQGKIITLWLKSLAKGDSKMAARGRKQKASLL